MCSLIISLDYPPPSHTMSSASPATNAAGGNTCRTCAAVGAVGVCTRCRAVVYCDQQCQRADWAQHKLACTRQGPTAPPGGPLGPPGPLELHVEVVPPAVYANANQEQNFSISAMSTNAWPDASVAIRKSDKSLSAEVRYVAARVSLQSARLAAVDEAFKIKAAQELTEAQRAQLQRASEVKVPLVLHYEPARFRITATRDGVRMWQKDVLYELPEAAYPRDRVAPTWERQSDTTLRACVTYDQMVAEEFEFVGDQRQIAFMSDDMTLGVQIGVQRVHNAATKKPLTFYTDRVYAMRQIAIFGDEELFA
jgi:hypothetical protein